MAYDDEGLVRDIREQPDDDAPRMVYADWLGEHGDDDRANFIRCQCWAEDVGRTTEERERFRADAAALLAQHRREWEQPLRELGATEVTFRRGLPSHIKIPATAFLEHASEVLQRAPVRSVHITNLAADQVQALASSPHLSSLRALNLLGNRIGDDGAEVLACSEHLRNLTALNLAVNDLGPAGAAALTRSEHLRNLTTLNLGRNGIGNAGAAALARSEHLRHLTELYLDGNGIRDAGATALARSEHLSNLTTLYLLDNSIGNAGATALANSPHLGNLMKLNLGYNRITPQALASVQETILSRSQQTQQP